MSDTPLIPPAIDQIRHQHGPALATALQTMWSAILSLFAKSSSAAIMPTTLTLPNLAQGSVLFVGPSGVVTEDNASLYFDDSGNTLSALKLSVYAGTSASTHPLVGGVIKDFIADVSTSGTGEDDLFTYTVQGNALDTNNQKIVAEYEGVIANAGITTARIKAYFAGTLIFDTGALAFVNGSSWGMYVTVIRESSSVVRCSVNFASSSTALLAATSTYTRITGLTLSNDNILKLTGEVSSAGAGELITAKLGYIEWKPASV